MDWNLNVYKKSSYQILVYAERCDLIQVPETFDLRFMGSAMPSGPSGPKYYNTLPLHEGEYRIHLGSALSVCLAGSQVSLSMHPKPPHEHRGRERGRGSASASACACLR